MVIPTVTATPASANLNGVFAANGDEDLADQFTQQDALFAYTVSDLDGGRICVIPASGDGSCADPGFGEPNFVVGIGTVYTLLEQPPLEPGSWRLRTESVRAPNEWVEGSTSDISRSALWSRRMFGLARHG
ncbi:MAG: hypothetical protein ABJD68_19210, partial [Nakamurella sp.]